jgi:hypothetical protein
MVKYKNNPENKKSRPENVSPFPINSNVCEKFKQQVKVMPTCVGKFLDQDDTNQR